MTGMNQQTQIAPASLNRRQFLRGSSLAVAGAAAVSQFPFALTSHAAPGKTTTVPAVTGNGAAKVVDTPSSAAKSKQQRLAELLEAYKKDQMSSADYHERRLKVLSEP